MILVDTSVWIDHLRSGNAQLTELLNENRVAMHPMILGELACGNLHNRQKLLHHLDNLEAVQTVNQAEALYFIGHNKLMGKGIGFIDVHLLASVSLTSGVRFWTMDKCLAQVATELNYSWEQ